jgi:hypothetical protein
MTGHPAQMRLASTTSRSSRLKKTGPSVPLPSLQRASDHHELSILGGLWRPEDMAESGGTNRD